MLRERKVVSVLFVDLVGFTGQSESADPEDVDALLRSYHRDVRREIERFGGTVEKFIGDAVVAVFGAPATHEDDAERAVRAALRILDVTDLDVRLAVNTGEVLVSLDTDPASGEGMVAGDAVNTASRLQNVAPVRGILVGEATHLATERAIEYEQLAAVELKGKSAPVPVWSVVGARSRFGVDAEAPEAAAFVGRQHELELLQRLFERALDDTGVQLVTVAGEPGAGKSRLVSELRRWVDDRPELIAWRQGRCLPYGDGSGYWALGEVVKAQAGILESDGPGEAEAKLELLLADMPESAWLHTRLAPLVGVDTSAVGGARDESFAAWRRFLEELADRTPLVLVFEDLHWASASMLEFINDLAEWSAGVPIYCICTTRPELFEHHPGWGGGKRNATTVSLSPLSDADTARLLAALLDRSVLPASTQALLLERAGGNPLFAEEFVRMLRDSDVDDADVPGSVQALIAARLDTLVPDRKRLIQDASVIGKVFWAGAVAALGAVGAGDVRSSLHELTRKELVKPSRVSSIESEQEYVFWHALVRDVAYNQIPRSERIERHVAAARWIETATAARVADHAEIVAHHYLTALELAQATASSDQQMLRSAAVDNLLLAGRGLMGVDTGAAQYRFSRAHDLLEQGDPRLAPTLLRIVEAGYALGDALETQRERLDRAESASREFGDDRSLGSALTLRSMLASDRTEHKLGLVDSAIEVLEPHPGPELARALAIRAAVFMLRDAASEAIDAANAALPMVERFGGADDMSLALAARGVGRCELGDAGGLSDLRRGLEVSQQAGGPWVPIAAINLAGPLWCYEGPAAGLEVYELGVAEAERRGQTTAWVKREMAWVLTDLGRWDEALIVAASALESARASGAHDTMAMAATAAATIHIRRGDLAPAAALVDEMLDAVRASVEPQVRDPGLAAAAEVRLAQRRREDAVGLLRDLQASHASGMFGCWQAPSAAATAVMAGELKLAESLAQRGVPYGLRGPPAVELAQGMCAEAKGDLQAALDLYDHAGQAFAQIPAVWEHCLCLVGSGRCLIGLSQEAGATEPITDARAALERLSASPAIAECDALLGVAAGRTAGGTT
jgi:class 3 adenylate cyclase/tetratricopeptide (TPR) repeat protein